MSIQSIVRNGRVYAKTELLLAEIRLRAYARKAVFFAIALGIALFGLGMLNVAAYQWLSRSWGPVETALVIAGVDFVVAALAALIGYTLAPGPELAMAEEMRNAALEATENEIALMQHGAVSGLMTGAVELGAARLLVPTVSALMKGFRRKPKEEAAETPPKGRAAKG